MIRGEDPYLDLNRSARREYAAREKRQRASGKWDPWQSFKVGAGDVPRLSGARDDSGWTHDVHTVWRNGWIVVLVRDCKTEWGIVQHACIRTALCSELNWVEKQKLKNEIFGENATAIEVFPAASSVIDECDVYHLWVLPAGVPFGLHASDACSAKHYRP